MKRAHLNNSEMIRCTAVFSVDNTVGELTSTISITCRNLSDCSIAQPSFCFANVDGSASTSVAKTTIGLVRAVGYLTSVTVQGHD